MGPENTQLGGWGTTIERVPARFFLALFVVCCVAERSASQPQGKATAVQPEAALGVRDVGIFSDLDPRVQLSLPGDLERAALHAVVDRARGQLVLYGAARPLKVYPLGGPAPLRVGEAELALRPGDAAELAPLLRAEALRVLTQRSELPPGDSDDDGIPDPLDVLIGAHKTSLNADHYDGRFEPIAFPGGDVPRTIGVCTDVVVRALRNAGIDLQLELQRDIARAPRAYPMIAQPSPHIDHRRVKSILPYFIRHFERRSARVDDRDDPLQPGDIVFFDTFPKRPGSEHVGIVSDERASDGLPLVINNWTDGTVTRPMALLPWCPVTHRFRVPARGPIAASAPQLIAVVSDDWASPRATLRRFARDGAGAWRAQGKALAVAIGHAGYGWGRGLHGAGAPEGRPGPIKREGDGRAPAGVFALGTLYGSAPRSPSRRWPYVRAGADLRCVDDPGAREYATMVSIPPGERTPHGEAMLRADGMYALALVVEHNTRAVSPGAGSCIFVHVGDAAEPTIGCTALPMRALRALAAWLEPGAVLVALPRAEYARFAPEWRLPEI
jgi:uncharacterized protein YijF (DUF1287 family)/L,D-peptidoglycan transpeptidase YkuD (ErfK/YbiS/YcfS/YnhG family)